MTDRLSFELDRCSALIIYYLVGRYKQCLDFSITIHFYHFLACWIYNSHSPQSFSWYVTHFLCIVAMTILSEHLSKKAELRTIPLATRVDL
jgi:protein SYS1